MTREEQNEAQALDLEERRREAEEAFDRAYGDWKAMNWEWPTDANESDWATIASEIGISDYYRKLKEGK